jgi:hypothetical protein
MNERNSVVLKHNDVFLTAASNKIVHDGHPVSVFPKVERNVRANEAATTGHENVQERILLQEFGGAGAILVLIHKQKSR